MGLLLSAFDPLLSDDTLNLPCYFNEVLIGVLPALPSLPAQVGGWARRRAGIVPSWDEQAQPREQLCLLHAGLFVCVSLWLSLMLQVFRNCGVFSSDQINVTKLIKCFNTQGEETEEN